MITNVQIRIVLAKKITGFTLNSYQPLPHWIQRYSLESFSDSKFVSSIFAILLNSVINILK
jgi:hypothetical protein